MITYGYNQFSTHGKSNTSQDYSAKNISNNMSLEIRAYAPKPHFANLFREKELIFQHEGKIRIFDIGRISRETKTLIEKQGGMLAWRGQEATTFVSALINKQIDDVCTQFGKGIPSHRKAELFKHLEGIAKREHITDKLDVNGANSSVKHCVMSNRYLIKQLRKLERNFPDDKNKINTKIIDKCAREIACDMLNISDKNLRSIENQAREMAHKILTAGG